MMSLGDPEVLDGFNHTGQLMSKILKSGIAKTRLGLAKPRCRLG